MFILTTDIQDLTDANHERKRDNPLNLCNLCSLKIEPQIYRISQNLIQSQKEIRIAARGEERDSKTLRGFYCFCIIHRLTKIQFLDGR